MFACIFFFFLGEMGFIGEKEKKHRTTAGKAIHWGYECRNRRYQNRKTQTNTRLSKSCEKKICPFTPSFHESTRDFVDLSTLLKWMLEEKLISRISSLSIFTWRVRLEVANGLGQVKTGRVSMWVHGLDSTRVWPVLKKGQDFPTRTHCGSTQFNPSWLVHVLGLLKNRQENPAQSELVHACQGKRKPCRFWGFDLINRELKGVQHKVEPT